MNPAIRHLVLIDTASRLATRIINGRRTTHQMPVSAATTPAQIEKFCSNDDGGLVFQRIVAELQLCDIK
jgi:hypothetical protein